MLLTIFLLVVALIILVFALASQKPDAFRVERSTTVNASPERVFALINDFRHFGEWSPWEKLDPAMTRTLTGPASGRGAVYEWSGNGKAGAGRMEIVESVPSSRVLMQLNFLKPFKSQSTAEYSIQSLGGTTKVTWAMHGPSPLASKVMQLFMSMDAMIGKDFEAGLANIKRAVEA
jgi:uncharacterized protein YndB with AHSA1/START domain